MFLELDAIEAKNWRTIARVSIAIPHIALTRLEREDLARQNRPADLAHRQICYYRFVMAEAKDHLERDILYYGAK